MGNENSNEQARDFFMGIGGKIEKGFDSAVNVATAPSRLMDSMGKFLTSPTTGIILPIVALGGLYIIMQFKK
jgi:hypothetical protein